jgi:hypothetical protein
MDQNRNAAIGKSSGGSVADRKSSRRNQRCSLIIVIIVTIIITLYGITRYVSPCSHLNILSYGGSFSSCISHSRPKIPEIPEIGTYNDDEHTRFSHHNVEYNPNKRYDLNTNKLACWPSTGGVWIRSQTTPAELLWLGIDRFSNTNRSSSVLEEDQFCSTLRTHGASWYSLPPKYRRETTVWCEDLDYCADPDKRVDLELGFTANGAMWVLDLKDTENPESGVPWQGLQNAVTMDERCEWLKKLGAKFCENFAACPETAQLVD